MDKWAQDLAVLLFFSFLFVCSAVAISLWIWRQVRRKNQVKRHQALQAHSSTVEESASGGYQVVE